MFRPNYAQDAPPTHIRVGGALYPVNVDFRTWVDILDGARELYAHVHTPEEARHNARTLARMQALAFGGVLRDEAPAEALRAMMEFARGYPSMLGEGGEEADADAEELLSFDYDINALVLAIRNQSGLDLSYRRREPFHWWEFLLEVNSLCGDHYILRVMQTRASRHGDRELRRAKQRVRLPHKPTAEEARALRALREAAGDGKERENAHRNADTPRDRGDRGRRLPRIPQDRGASGEDAPR